MIKSITPYNTSFGIKQNFAQRGSQKVARKVVELEKSSLKGITKSPIRFSKLDEGADCIVDNCKFISGAASLFAPILASVISSDEGTTPFDSGDGLTMDILS